MAKPTKKEISEARAMLHKLGVRRGATIYTVLRHVSRSGMSRRIDLYVIRKNEPVFITGYVGRLMGYSMHRDGGLTVGGCGMDMGFHLVNSLCYAMFDGLARTRRAPVDLGPMKGKGYRYRGKDWHAGYELDHRWI